MSSMKVTNRPQGWGRFTTNRSSSTRVICSCKWRTWISKLEGVWIHRKSALSHLLEHPRYYCGRTGTRWPDWSSVCGLKEILVDLPVHSRIDNVLPCPDPPPNSGKYPCGMHGQSWTYSESDSVFESLVCAVSRRRGPVRWSVEYCNGFQAHLSPETIDKSNKN